MSDTETETRRLPLSETVTRQKMPRHTLDPKSVGCYASKAEVDAAVEAGTFDINKTQYYCPKRRRQYFLVYR